MDPQELIPTMGAGPGSAIVRAWFDTVINPLITAFELERTQLERKDWTWNHWRLQLDSIRPVERHLEPQVLPNVKQLFRHNQILSEVANHHDLGVQALWESCGVMQSVLEKDPDFIAVYRESVLPENLEKIGSSIEQMFGRNSEADNVATLVEYTINHRPDLPSHYTTYLLWNAWRERFAATMIDSKSSEIRNWYQGLTSAGEYCLKKVRDAIVQFEERRDELSITHDVPIVKAA